MNKPLISVIVPVYNGGVELKSLLEMLKIQAGIEAIEVIVVDCLINFLFHPLSLFF